MENKKVCHLKSCRVVTADETCAFRFGKAEYVLSFVSQNFKRGEGIVIEGPPDQFHPAPGLLRWIQVYFGEDVSSPRQEVNTVDSATRGDFVFDARRFRYFLGRAEKFPRRSWHAWRVELFERALTYYSMGLRFGINAMPITIGLFALSLECIGNLRNSSRGQYSDLGAMRFLNLANTRMARYKRSDRFRERARELAAIIRFDVELMHLIRNAYYGHSRAHMVDDRRKLIEKLRAWQLRGGMEPKWARLNLSSRHLDSGIISEAPGLYKVGVRMCRWFLFMLVGFHRPPPFASHDFTVVADFRRLGEPRIGSR